MEYKLIKGSMLEVLDTFEENSIDCIVTDPPYELGFMGKGWDKSGVAFQIETWAKCLRVLKPGGYLLAFGGSRTFHRMACAIEDAEFEIRDTLFWLYGSGFPKGQNIGKQIDAKINYGKANSVNLRNLELEQGTNEKVVKQSTNGFMNESKEVIRKDYVSNNEWNGWNTALKPAYEPIIMARKPFKGSLVDNVLKYGVGGINIDECRVGKTGATKKTDLETCNNSHGIYGNGLNGGKVLPISNGRYPANILHDGSDEVKNIFPETNPAKAHDGDGNLLDTRDMGWGFKRMPSNIEDDGGNASRYFYCAKASKKDRDEGLDEFEDKLFTSALNTKNGSGERLDGGKTPIRKNIHPTVKPTELMQYLVRLVAPKGAIILDPFNGSGSTGKAVAFENRERNMDYKYIGIDLSQEYLDISKARIDYAINKFEYNFKKELEEKNKVGQLTLFDDV